jgi:hypothetical protein
MKTYIVAKDYEDGHQLTRFVTTDDEKELRKHWTRIARVERIMRQPHPRNMHITVKCRYLLAIVGLVNAAYSEQPCFG